MPPRADCAKYECYNNITKNLVDSCQKYEHIHPVHVCRVFGVLVPTSNAYLIHTLLNTTVKQIPLTSWRESKNRRHPTWKRLGFTILTSALLSKFVAEFDLDGILTFPGEIALL